MVYRVKICGFVGCRPLGGEQEPETNLSKDEQESFPGETRSENTIRRDEMGQDGGKQAGEEEVRGATLGPESSWRDRAFTNVSNTMGAQLD